MCSGMSPLSRKFNNAGTWTNHATPVGHNCGGTGCAFAFEELPATEILVYLVCRGIFASAHQGRSLFYIVIFYVCLALCCNVMVIIIIMTAI